MTIDPRLYNVNVFCPTPTDAGGNIDIPRLERMVGTAVDTGAQAVTIFGSVGTVGYYPDDQRKAAAEAAVAASAGRAHVAVGCGAMRTETVIDLARHAEAIGADSALVVPVAYWVLNEAEILAHYKAIHDATGIAIGLYNNPRLTGNDMTPEILARLAEALPRAAYVKESGADIHRMALTRRLVGDRLAILLGRENLGWESMALGADGWTSVLAAWKFKDVAEVFGLMKDAKDYQLAWEKQQKHLPLGDFMLTRGLARVVYNVWDLVGDPIGTPPRPLKKLSDAADLAELARLMELSEIPLAGAARNAA